MRKARFLSVCLVTMSAIGLFLTASFGSVLNMSSMHMMPKNQCQSSCGVQSPIASQAVRNDIEDKDIEPQPNEPFYLSLIVFGSIAAATAIVLKLYRAQWPPPNRLAMICLLRI